MIRFLLTLFLVFFYCITKAQTITYSSDTAWANSCFSPISSTINIQNNTSNNINLNVKGLNVYFNSIGFTGLIIDPWQYPGVMGQYIATIDANDSTEVIVLFFPDTITGSDSAIAQIEVYDPADSINTYKILTYVWTCKISSIDQNINCVNNIQLFPNPFTEKLNLKINFPGNYEFQLLDLTSRKILKEKINNSGSFNTSNIPKGIYIYQILNKSKIIKGGKILRH